MILQTQERSDWPVDKLGRRATIGNGSTPSREKADYWDNGQYPWLNSSVVNRARVSTPSDLVTKAALSECHLPLVPIGSILVGLTGQGRTRGMASLLEIEATISQHLAFIVPDQNFWHPPYLRYLLTARYESLRELSDENGSTKGGLTCADLAAFKLPMPPLDDQRRISDFLDLETCKTDELIAKQERLVSTLREHRSAAISASVPNDCAAVRLKYFTKYVRQGFSPQCESTPADGITEWGVLKVGCVNGGVFRPTENKLLPLEVEPRPELVIERGDLVVSRANTRDLVGSAAVVHGDFPRLMLSDKTYALALDEDRAVPEFIALILGTPKIRQLIELEATGASHSMQNISQADILNLPVTLPTVEDQKNLISGLASELARIDRLICRAGELIQFMKERRAALVAAAVTGQIDVTNYSKGN